MNFSLFEIYSESLESWGFNFFTVGNTLQDWSFLSFNKLGDMIVFDVVFKSFAYGDDI